MATRHSAPRGVINSLDKENRRLDMKEGREDQEVQRLDGPFIISCTKFKSDELTLSPSTPVANVGTLNSIYDPCGLSSIIVFCGWAFSSPHLFVSVLLPGQDHGLIKYLPHNAKFYCRFLTKLSRVVR